MMRKLTLGLVAGASSLLCVNSANAQEFYIGQTLMFGYSFCPLNTLEANGQLVSISEYDALFALIGTTYGGNGTTNFALPNLAGRAPINHGQGPGQPSYAMGQMAGAETQTLTNATMPMHVHSGYSVGSSGGPTVDNPTGAAPATYNVNPKAYTSGQPNVSMKPGTAVLDNVGGSQPFDMRDPYLAIRYCVVVQGIYPSHP